MPKEIEIKYAVANLSAVGRRLREAGAVFLGTVLQADVYFDTPRRQLLAADSGLRLRTVRCVKAGAERVKAGALMTFKGPSRRGGKAKVRTEHQTQVGDPAVVAEILAACGLQAMLTIEKRRSAYRLGRCRVELDRLPILGCFVEIEAPSQREILSTARRLGLDGLPLKAHYVNLLRKGCRRVAAGCKTVAFARCDRQCGRRR